MHKHKHTQRKVGSVKKKNEREKGKEEGEKEGRGGLPSCRFQWHPGSPAVWRTPQHGNAALIDEQGNQHSRPSIAHCARSTTEPQPHTATNLWKKK